METASCIYENMAWRRGIITNIYLWYLATPYIQGIHNICRRPYKGDVWGFCCECKVWTTFYIYRCRFTDNTMWRWVVYKHCAMLEGFQKSLSCRLFNWLLSPLSLYYVNCFTAPLTEIMKSYVSTKIPLKRRVYTTCALRIGYMVVYPIRFSSSHKICTRLFWVRF